MPTVRHKVSQVLAGTDEESVAGLIASGQWELEGEAAPAPAPVRKPRARKPAAEPAATTEE